MSVEPNEDYVSDETFAKVIKSILEKPEEWSLIRGGAMGVVYKHSGGFSFRQGARDSIVNPEGSVVIAYAGCNRQRYDLSKALDKIIELSNEQAREKAVQGLDLI